MALGAFCHCALAVLIAVVSQTRLERVCFAGSSAPEILLAVVETASNLSFIERGLTKDSIGLIRCISIFILITFRVLIIYAGSEFGCAMASAVLWDLRRFVRVRGAIGAKRINLKPLFVLLKRLFCSQERASQPYLRGAAGCYYTYHIWIFRTQNHGLVTLQNCSYLIKRNVLCVLSFSPLYPG